MCLGFEGALCSLHRPADPDARPLKVVPAQHIPGTFSIKQRRAIRTLAALSEQWDGVQDGHVPPDDVLPNTGADKFTTLAFIDRELVDAMRVLKATGATEVQ